MTIKPLPGIETISPYVGGTAKLPGQGDVLKLSSNENLAGPSDHAKKAYADAAAHLHLYPSATHFELRQAIGEVHGLNPDNIVCGAGSDEIISLLCHAYAGPGDEVIHSEHGFEMHKISALATGATPVMALECNRHCDVDAILAVCTSATRLVFIANPANPTGTMISSDEIARLADHLPPQVLLVLDGAYAEFVEGYDAGARFVQNRQNVVITRTFSKIYGLGALRVGYGYGPDHVIGVLNRVRGPFNVAAAALVAAKAAVRDTAHTEKCRQENEKWRDWLAEKLAELQIHSDPAYGNFILARFGSADEAEAADSFLKTKGLLVRRVINYHLPEALRITIGDEIACRRVVAALREFKEGA